MDYPDWDVTWEEAVRSGLKYRVEMKLLDGSDVNQKIGDVKDTALHVACLHADFHVIILLIENGADVNRKKTST